ncbi:hypothetical protein [Lewinella sp. W8]|uniref:hypothetical protein n=1 Tax=Lewinella sp. W8 TaxID=2528208 RepID=UPI00106816AE|nr:hypothetical protein [Lewinella sp. W8]MTB53923.1 hypothetical protein [Lewinella sp. W8]
MELLLEKLPEISGIFSLLAFLASIYYFVNKSNNESIEKRIELAPEKTRGAIVEKFLTEERLDLESLTKQQRYELAIKRINAKERRLRAYAMYAFLAGVLLIFLSGVVYWINQIDSGNNDPLSGYESFPTIEKLTFRAISDDNYYEVDNANLESADRFMEIIGDNYPGIYYLEGLELTNINLLGYYEDEKLYTLEFYHPDYLNFIIRYKQPDDPNNLSRFLENYPNNSGVLKGPYMLEKLETPADPGMFYYFYPLTNIDSHLRKRLEKTFLELDQKGTSR